jgi:hypothetical protein
MPQGTGQVGHAFFTQQLGDHRVRRLQHTLSQDMTVGLIGF